MQGLAIRWLVLTGSILVVAYLLEGIHVSGFFSAFFAAAALSTLNALFRPILLVLTLPINVLSLGLFTLVINAAMLKMAQAVIPGFEVVGFWTSVFGALLISLVSWALNSFISGKGGVKVIDMRNRRGNFWD
ncbi:MAG: phage holin family protein [Desulfatibacillum sp.]|nr:phage holin family protein [Desulfatibacillum sp.]